VRRQWHVRIERNSAYVRGYGTRELLTEMRHRAPVWSRSEKAWTCQPSTARDLIALAQARHIDVVVAGPGVNTPQHVAPTSGVMTPEVEGLW
jgi:hypothetical protein